jgi:hypothetical protein
MNSNITLNLISKTRRQIIKTAEDAKKRIGDDQSPTQTQHRHLITAGVNYYDQAK